MLATATKKRKQISVDRGPQTDDELWWFVFATWGVKIPRTAVCYGHVAPFTAFANAYFARDAIAIWKASRGFGGKTQTLSILGMTELVALGAQVTILGGSGEQSQRVHETMKQAWNFDASPSHLLLKEPTKYNTDLMNGAHARTLMASQKSVRGPHPQRMRLDEIDEMELEVLEAAQGQPMRKKNKYGDWVETQTVMSSTQQYPDGTMKKMMMRAKEKGWALYEWCFRESSNPVDGWLSEDEIERKRNEVNDRMWAAEYELQEPSFEGRAIDEAAVDRMFDPFFGEAEGGVGKYIEVESPRTDRDYVTGVDWAKARDFTVIWTFDTTEEPWKTVAFERINRRPWPMMIGRLNTRLERYGGSVCFDATGIGSVVEDYIVVPRHVRPENIIGKVMGGRDRNDMLNNYISGIEQDLIRAPRIKWPYEEHKFATPEDLFGTSSANHLPDSIAAGALAWSLRKKGRRIAVPVISIARENGSPWIGRP